MAWKSSNTMKCCQKIVYILVKRSLFFLSLHPVCHWSIQHNCMLMFWPKWAEDKLEADELLLDSTQRSIYSLIFFLKASLLITISIFTLYLKYILCSNNNIGSHRQGRIGSWVSLHRIGVSCYVLLKGGKPETLSFCTGFLTIPLTKWQQTDKSQTVTNLLHRFPHAVYMYISLQKVGIFCHQLMWEKNFFK